MAGKRSPKNQDRTPREQPTRTEEDNGQRVSRPLDDAGIEKRRQRLATVSIEVLDLEEERTAHNKEINAELKAKKQEVRKLATEIKTREEMIPAQMALSEAANARRGAERGSTQDIAAPVAAKLTAVSPAKEP